MSAEKDEQVAAALAGPDLGGSRRMGMVLFLASLAMLFGASIAAFAYLRLTSAALVGTDPVELPLELYGSTAGLLGAGLAMHRAWQSARRGDFLQLRQWLVWTWLSSALFMAIQTPAMLELLQRHRGLEGTGIGNVYGITFALIVVHALHVVGGMVPLSNLAWKAQRRRLDSEHLLSVRACAAYWHFLEAVWVLLLVAFYLCG